ncbi:alpha/beta fold hydrolase [Sneathiella glossodoripedis]|uniref:alpha/beta fold hydrolase n=1 Tax=Sneathiella glossodoripedis TaxID=418853 RepID=UPI00046E6213|nr:alpha/beta hydrolase [Sneathiella glossodoripedis]
MSTINQGVAELGTINLHYAETGADNKELIILLHGFPEFWFTWRKQLPVLGEKYHAVAPDMRGYNLSDRPEGVEAYRINQLIDDIKRLAKHFGADQFYLASHDWGAAVAWSVALAHPELIKGLMILNGPHPYIFARLLENNPKQIAHSQYMADFREAGIEQKLAANNFKWLWDWTFAEHERRGQITADEKEEYLRAWGQPGAITAMLNYYRASPLKPRPAKEGEKSLELTPEHFHVNVPTMVLWGEQDHALIPENLDGIGDFVPDLKLIRLPEVTHWVTHEAPDRVSQEILEFLTEIKAR